MIKPSIRFLHLSLALLAVLTLASVTRAQLPAPLIIQGGMLIDGTGRAPLDDAVIVVEGERIKSVGKRGEIAVSRLESYRKIVEEKLRAEERRFD